ncbi:DUF664 domain-containing protein [Rudanella paleaurantiibacter]|uniref:DUF664 domain-containing protein n=1 Tax=Rudanella paleaurantiibacter TaxID=2614655 RepID=A0A7J5U5H0_9BACT|nr:DinB family protein [Rudanella paleaurantiibacter]KAB7733088.1 DUF664 domain-containing protein [Rudanella paleaurantiibacter]
MQKLTTATDLQARLNRILDTVEREFRPLTDAQLRTKPANGGWSIIECLQHLNLAERFYIRQLQHKVDQLGLVQHRPTDQTLESDWIGRLMIKVVDPKNTRKIPAPGVIKPRTAADLDVGPVLHQFVELQTLLNSLLDKAIYLDWNREKVPTLLGNWLKMRLGDAIQMLVLHTERHMAQAMRVKEGLPY